MAAAAASRSLAAFSRNAWSRASAMRWRAIAIRPSISASASPKCALVSLASQDLILDLTINFAIGVDKSLPPLGARRFKGMARGFKLLRQLCAAALERLQFGFQRGHVINFSEAPLIVSVPCKR
jgi:hypothetical protein